MIADFLAALLRVNLVGAAAVLLVLALRRPARRLFGARAAYRLWAVAPLACIALLAPARTAIVPAASGPAILAGPAFATAAPITPYRRTAVTAVVPRPTPRSVSVSPTQALFAIWLAGFALSVGLLGWRQRRFLAMLGRLRPGDAGLFLAEGAGVGPAVVGCIAPRVIVPADFGQRFTPEEQTVVLAHERAHLARQDARANGLLALAQCLCWFNPVAHLAARLVRLDQELACDAEVMGSFPTARRRYAEALLKTQIAAAPLPLGCYWPARATHPLEERIAMLKAPVPSASRRTIGLVATLALCCAGGVAAWASQPAQVVVTRTAPWSSVTPVAPPAPVAQFTQAAPPAAPAQSVGVDAAGDWIGAIKSPDLRLAIHLHKTATGFGGTLDSPDQGAYDLGLDGVTVSGDALSFSVPKVMGAYQGRWDAAAHQWVGQWTQQGVNWPLALASGRYAPPAAIAGLDGSWDTQLAAGTGTLRLGFTIVTDAHGTHGTMDSPDQNTYHLPLSTISRDGGAVTLAFKMSDVTLSGDLAADGKTITGTFKQFGASLPMVLTRRAPGAAAPYPPPHAVAQAPKPPIVDVDPKVLAAYAGTYRIAPGLDIVVTVEDGKVFAQVTNQPKIELFASSPVDFFWKQTDAQLTFAAPGAGAQAPYVILHQGGRYLLGQRT